VGFHGVVSKIFGFKLSHGDRSAKRAEFIIASEAKQASRSASPYQRTFARLSPRFSALQPKCASPKGWMASLRSQ